MEAIAQLQQQYVLLKAGVGDFQACINWAIERLQKDQEGDDLQVVLLAGATKPDDVRPLVEDIIRKYRGPGGLDEELIAGKYVAWLRGKYLEGKETIESIDAKLTKIYHGLGYPNWLVRLTCNCEYATDIPAYVEPFEQEFKYIADLWASAGSVAEFASKYSRAISNGHDAK